MFYHRQTGFLFFPPLRSWSTPIYFVIQTCLHLPWVGQLQAGDGSTITIFVPQVQFSQAEPKLDTGRSVMCLEMWISSFKDNNTACSFKQLGRVEWHKHSHVLVGATTAWISTLWCQPLTTAALNNLCVPANLHNLLLEKIMTSLSSCHFSHSNILWLAMLLAHVTGNNSYWSLTQPYLMNQ